MEAVIDPSGPTIVGYVPLNACRNGGPWASFITLPVPDGADQEALGVTYDSETQTYTFVTDPQKVQAKLDAAWTALRTERNRRLQASDWTQMPDAPLSQDRKTQWADYRQALRDLPEELQDPLNVEWPQEPGSVQVPVSGSRLDNLMGQV